MHERGMRVGSPALTSCESGEQLTGMREGVRGRRKHAVHAGEALHDLLLEQLRLSGRSRAGPQLQNYDGTQVSQMREARQEGDERFLG